MKHDGGHNDDSVLNGAAPVVVSIQFPFDRAISLPFEVIHGGKKEKMLILVTKTN